MKWNLRALRHATCSRDAVQSRHCLKSIIILLMLSSILFFSGLNHAAYHLTRAKVTNFSGSNADILTLGLSNGAEVKVPRPINLNQVKINDMVDFDYGKDGIKNVRLVDNTSN